jgi:hypothetical protein
MKFLDEIKSIPIVAWLIALLLAGGVLLLAPNMSAFEMLFISCACLFIFVWVLIIGYICVDAQRRGMHRVMWTLLSIFIPYGIGVILYFVLRDPLLTPCPKCGIEGRANYIFCPHCGADMSPYCPACKRAVELDWNRCAHCGADLSGQSAVGSR